jgi:hypothetical protein
MPKVNDYRESTAAFGAVEQVCQDKKGQVLISQLNVGLLGRMFAGVIALVMGMADADLNAVVGSAAGVDPIGAPGPPGALQAAGLRPPRAPCLTSSGCSQCSHFSRITYPPHRKRTRATFRANPKKRPFPRLRGAHIPGPVETATTHN